MRDLTPEEREQIYLEEKARRDALLEREEHALQAQRAEQRKREDEEQSTQALLEAHLRQEREAQEAKARSEALLEFARIEEEAQAQRRAQQTLDHLERKVQERIRLEQWQAGTTRNIKYFAILATLIVFSMCFQIEYITAPVLCCVILGKELNMKKGWITYMALLVGCVIIFFHVTG